MYSIYTPPPLKGVKMGDAPFSYAVYQRELQRRRVRRVRNIAIGVVIGINIMMIVTGSTPTWSGASSERLLHAGPSLTVWQASLMWLAVWIDAFLIGLSVLAAIVLVPDVVEAMWRTYINTGTISNWRQEYCRMQSED